MKETPKTDRREAIKAGACAIAAYGLAGHTPTGAAAPRGRAGESSVRDGILNAVSAEMENQPGVAGAEWQPGSERIEIRHR